VFHKQNKISEIKNTAIEGSILVVLVFSLGISLAERGFRPQAHY